MLKGSQKKMIVVRTRDSRLFEEAYFVMRHDGVSPADSRQDMLAEAHRIINGETPAPSAADPRSRPPMGLRRALWFICGLLCGGGGVALICCLL